MNNETDYNKNNNIDDKKSENLINQKSEKNENKPFRSLKSMKIESQNRFGKGLQESASQSNRVCKGRRFYKRKQDDIQTEIK